MYRFRPSWFATASRFLYTHNPFYLISALLVLYGLHRSTGGPTDWKGDALTVGLLFGYTLLLALSALAVVRFGKVWDDARTMMLVIVLLFLAISVRFDAIALRNPQVGGGLLLAGFAFAVLLSEGLLRGLGIRLAAMYRGPYYLLLALLFFYPVWLAQLSVEGHDQRMAWGVFLFPAVASGAMLTLWPAARWGGPPGAFSGTPWRWPWYPWSLFTVIVVGIGLRSYWLSISFQVGKVSEISFQPYFLLPLGLVAAILFLELALAASSKSMREVALWVPLGLLLLAFPGRGGSKIAVGFLSDLCQHVGSPAQLALGGLIVFYAVTWARGIQAAQWGMMGCLAASAWIDSQSVSLSDLAGPAMLPLTCVAVIQLGLAWWHDQLWRMALPLAIALGIAWQHVWQHWPVELGIYCAVHFSIVGLLLAGALVNDDWARRLRLLGSAIVPAAALVALLTYETLFAAVPRSVDAGYVSMLAVVSLLFWYRTTTVANLIGAIGTTGVLISMQLQQLMAAFGQSILAKGWPWLAWGLVFFVIGMTISSMKGGAWQLIVRQLSRVNDRLRNIKVDEQ